MYQAPPLPPLLKPDVHLTCTEVASTVELSPRLRSLAITLVVVLYTVFRGVPTTTFNACVTQQTIKTSATPLAFFGSFSLQQLCRSVPPERRKGLSKYLQQPKKSRAGAAYKTRTHTRRAQIDHERTPLLRGQGKMVRKRDGLVYTSTYIHKAAAVVLFFWHKRKKPTLFRESNYSCYSIFIYLRARNKTTTTSFY